MTYDDKAFPYAYETNETNMMGDRCRVIHHQEGLSLKDYAAIHLKVPQTGDPELDAMIRESPEV
jgi:hypothetical protein